MAASISVKVHFNSDRIQEMFSTLLDDDTMMYEIHNALARRCDPYVPFLTGMLANSGTSGVTPEGVHYAGPYARYQYYGVDFNHTIEYHPLATAMWDKAMMAAEGDSFIKEVEDIVKRRARQLYGR